MIFTSQLLARGNYDFTQDQLDWIYSIAALCPFEAGPAVYRAKVIGFTCGRPTMVFTMISATPTHISKSQSTS